MYQMNKGAQDCAGGREWEWAVNRDPPRSQWMDKIIGRRERIQDKTLRRNERKKKKDTQNVKEGVYNKSPKEAHLVDILISLQITLLVECSSCSSSSRNFLATPKILLPFQTNVSSLVTHLFSTCNPCGVLTQCGQDTLRRKG